MKLPGLSGTKFAGFYLRRILESLFLDEHHTFRKPISDLLDVPYYTSFLPLSFHLKRPEMAKK